MVTVEGLSERAVEFLTECEYGDELRVVQKPPRKYAWLPSLMVDLKEIVGELEEKGYIVRDPDGHLFVNMSKLPQLEAILRVEEKWHQRRDM